MPKVTFDEVDDMTDNEEIAKDLERILKRDATREKKRKHKKGEKNKLVY